ncbi:hypothetical protein V8E36_006443 [Tilletia maclaganii]
MRAVYTTIFLVSTAHLVWGAPVVRDTAPAENALLPMSRRAIPWKLVGAGAFGGALTDRLLFHHHDHQDDKITPSPSHPPMSYGTSAPPPSASTDQTLPPDLAQALEENAEIEALAHADEHESGAPLVQRGAANEAAEIGAEASRIIEMDSERASTYAVAEKGKAVDGAMATHDNGPDHKITKSAGGDGAVFKPPVTAGSEALPPYKQPGLGPGTTGSKLKYILGGLGGGWLVDHFLF